MNIEVTPLKGRETDARVDAIIKLAVMAVGGQGGGVLSNWIIDVAERNNYAVQATSVAGVAQRTGATIYYVEMLPQSDRQPVFSLMPAAGDVDILIAAEMMEAGRAMMRGFVTPDRTTLIASSHRALATSEKIVPGNGISDTAAVREAASQAAQRFIAFDMEKIAVDAGSVISASLFGALAGAGALPFSRESFEETIKASGRGVDASLKAFSDACDRAAGKAPAPALETPKPIAKEPGQTLVDERLLSEWRTLTARVDAMPEPARDMVLLGLKKVVDFQDIAYGAEYLDRVDRALAIDRADDGAAREWALTGTAAKYIANAMAYDDVIRVADLKTRRSRFNRVNDEIGVADDQVLKITEFMHPRAEEVCGMLPAGMGRRIEDSPRLFGLLDKMVNRGRRVRTDSVFWFVVLYGLAGMRRWRRGLLRHEIEKRHLDAWLESCLDHASRNYDLGVEMLTCRRLVKGYSDTHVRGLSKFDKVMEGVALVADRADAADWARRLREAALTDVKGEALDGALETVRSFAVVPD